MTSASNLKSTLDHPLFKIIEAEHKKILDITSGLFDSKLLLTELFEKISQHHYKEETLLFSEIKKEIRLTEGGPLCTYFYDEQILSPPLELAEAITGKKPPWLSYQESLKTPQTPILIPINEHRSIQLILSFFSENHITGIKNSISHINKFSNLLMSNIKKEETCLFHVCLKILTLEQLNSIYTKWIN